ncbi:MAG: 30S ribosomal protein S9 [Pedosphaera sp.]|nr:30S ribosomal protein S9 [Pedosphaera sp.]|tara:strand:+ start:2753 stop:3157 length:405 start_codon:yes stop_codon:yes gene_type:complete
MAVDEKTGELLGTGRRKSATARVRIKPGSGKITVNHRNVETYFPIDEHRMIINEPFQVTENAEKFDVRVNVQGGGTAGQAEAIRLGISRALLLHDAELRAALKAEGLLTRDSRVRERKKPGQPGARKNFQFSKR